MYFGRPGSPQVIGVIRVVSDETAWWEAQQIPSANDISNLAANEHQCVWPPLAIDKRVQLDRAAAARAPYGLRLRPSFSASLSVRSPINPHPVGGRTDTNKGGVGSESPFLDHPAPYQHRYQQSGRVGVTRSDTG